VLILLGGQRGPHANNHECLTGASSPGSFAMTCVHEPVTNVGICPGEFLHSRTALNAKDEHRAVGRFGNGAEAVPLDRARPAPGANAPRGTESVSRGIVDHLVEEDEIWHPHFRLTHKPLMPEHTLLQRADTGRFAF
jgi:hypothetical protein